MPLFQCSICLGWYGDFFNLFISHNLQSCFISLLIKTDPRSVKSSAGKPILKKISIMALATVVASTLLMGTASGYLDPRHMHVNKYLFLHEVQGSGPTRSKAIWENGVPITKSGCKGALAGLDLLAFWQSGHALHHICTSKIISGHVNSFCIASFVFFTEN